MLEYSLRVCEMKKLNKAQSYGLIAMLAGFILYLGIAILFPQARILWILAWAVAFVGAAVYAVATFPNAIKWLKKIVTSKGQSS